MNKNPIFIEYYSHEGCDCYKVLNPWTQYAQEKAVLCPVSEGIDAARAIARKTLVKELDDALRAEIDLSRPEQVTRDFVTRRASSTTL